MALMSAGGADSKKMNNRPILCVANVAYAQDVGLKLTEVYDTEYIDSSLRFLKPCNVRVRVQTKFNAAGTLGFGVKIGRKTVIPQTNFSYANQIINKEATAVASVNDVLSFVRYEVSGGGEIMYLIRVFVEQ